MKKSKFSEEQVAHALRQAESGTAVADVCRQLGVSEATFYLWKKMFAHLGVSELRRMRSLEDQNARLKHVVAERASAAVGGTNRVWRAIKPRCGFVFATSRMHVLVSGISAFGCCCDAKAGA